MDDAVAASVTTTVECSSRARAYWFLVACLMLDLAVSPVSLFVEYLAGVLFLLFIPLFLIMLVERLCFSRSFPEVPWQRIRGHLASALLLWFVSWSLAFLSHGRNGILLVIPPIWIIWITRVARRLAALAPGADTLASDPAAGAAQA